MKKSIKVAVSAMLIAGAAVAQAAYPERTVRLIVPATAGGPSDIVARLIAEKLGALWGQSVVVENRPGAAQMIAAGVVANAKPDGYTLLQATSNMATNPIFHEKMPYDPESLVAITQTHSTPMAVAINADVPATSMLTLLDHIKSNADDLAYATSGEGSSQQLAMLQLIQTADLPGMVEVPYQGSSQAHPDLISGRVDMTIDPVAAIAPHIRSGALRGLAVTANERLPALPDVPTLAESGLPDVDLAGWGGVFGPVGTPEEVLSKINNDLNSVLQSPDVVAKFAEIGLVAQPSTAEEFTAFIAAERDRWGQVVAQAKANP